jgi:hypothetical protein
MTGQFIRSEGDRYIIRVSNGQEMGLHWDHRARKDAVTPGDHIHLFLNRPKDSSNHSGNRPHSLRFQGEVIEAGEVDVPTEVILEVSSGREKWWRAASAIPVKRDLAG